MLCAPAEVFVTCELGSLRSSYHAFLFILDPTVLYCDVLSYLHCLCTTVLHHGHFQYCCYNSCTIHIPCISAGACSWYLDWGLAVHNAGTVLESTEGRIRCTWTTFCHKEVQAVLGVSSSALGRRCQGRRTLRHPDTHIILADMVWRVGTQITWMHAVPSSIRIYLSVSLGIWIWIGIGIWVGTDPMTREKFRQAPHK